MFAQNFAWQILLCSSKMSRVQLEGDGKQSQPQCTQQQLFELLRLLPYNQPEEAVDACLLLSACGGHGLGAQLASDIHKAVSATRSTLVQQTNWFLGCALLVANAGVMTRLETVSEHNTRLVEACRKEHPLPFSAPTLRLRIVRQTKGKVLLSKK